MNTFYAVELTPGRWGVEWHVDDVSHGLVFGTYDSRPEALHAVLVLALMEAREAGAPNGIGRP